ncbi:MAG: quinoprotein dehydrogenase-associated putative ABC transporter substrate-binding protein [Myxococcales bacterium]
MKRIPRSIRGLLLVVSCAAIAAFAASAQAPPAEPKALRVCADPDNLPFSDKEGEGFENRIATVIAEDLGMKVEYFYWPHRRGFMRNTIKANECDVLMGIPKGMDGFLVTKPYYRSTYQFVSRVDKDHDISSLDDPRLKNLRIGVHTIGYDYNNSPAARSLGARKIVGLTGFSTFYTDENRPNAIIEALAEDKIDLAIVWGPIAGYFAKQSPVPLSLGPLPDVDESTKTPYTFDIVVGVRKSEKDLRARIDESLERKKDDIAKILAEFSVPLAVAKGPEHALQPASTSSQRPDKLLATADEYQGWKWFHVYCFRCHGVDAMGSDLAPNLRKSVSSEGLITHELFLNTVKEGRQEKGMQSWKALLDDSQIEQLYAYVKARSEQRLDPGRPHRATASQ